MLVTGQTPTEKISPELQIIMDRVKEKTKTVFEKFPNAFDGVKPLMDQSDGLEDYYTKLETYLDSYLNRKA